MSADGTVTALRRYPVKSTLGEDARSVLLTASGVQGDRVAAVIDTATGRVASAKHPKLWRGLLSLSSGWDEGSATVTLPDGTTLAVGHPGLDEALSRLLGRDVEVSRSRPAGASVARPVPEDVIEQGEDAEVPYEEIEIGRGSPGATFVDHSPVHLVTTASLGRARAEMVRYRPNLVLDLPGAEPYEENDWAGRDITIGPVILRVTQPTSRCAVPTLAHGPLPRSPDAVRTLLRENRIPVPGHGPRPCLGAYARVVQGGKISVGDLASLT